MMNLYTDEILENKNNDSKPVPAWAQAEHMEMSLPEKMLWKGQRDVSIVPLWTKSLAWH